MSIRVTIQEALFDSGEALKKLEHSGSKTGAVCSFSGIARDYGDQDGVRGLFIEHYPGMTESAIEALVQEAQERWPFQACTVIHRVGTLEPGEPIVFVGVASSHRREAFEACQYIMDALKTRAPFWKKEITREGETWVAQKESDRQAQQRWGRS